jgi:uncharacterized protein YoxC
MVGLAVMVMAVTLVVLAAAIVPAFLEIKKAAAASRESLERIEADLRPLLKELHDTLSDLNLIVHETAEKREDVATFMGALGDTGRSLRTINSVAGTVAGFLASSSLWLTGAKVAGKFALDKFISKGGKKHVEQ